MTNSADGYIRHTVHGPVRQWAHRRRSQAQCLTGGVSRQTVSMDHSITHVHITTVGHIVVESSWNVTAHGDARVGKWRGNWWMERVPSTLHTTSEHGVSSITTADAHTSAASSRLNWSPSADLNGLVRFAERRNLVSARVPSHFKRSLPV